MAVLYLKAVMLKRFDLAVVIAALWLLATLVIDKLTPTPPTATMIAEGLAPIAALAWWLLAAV